MKSSPVRNAPPLALWVTLTAFPILSTFFFSSQDAETSGSLSLLVLNFILSVCPPLSALGVPFLHHFIRKLAHFTLYCVLGVGLRGLYTYQRRFPAVPGVVAAGVLFAALDEFHQRFSAGRAPGISDVLLDTCGVAVGCVLLSLLFHLTGRTRAASA
ncbi:MAG: VanZ family protein [Oscillibacter sp.]|nr:VanZ family protein [Oscillibacter sp.]MBQ7680798.1 VanZ family protein [Oscillibacter sp.]